MGQSCGQRGLLVVVLLSVIGISHVLGQQGVAEERKDDAISTIQSLADWPNSDDHWSDIPGWPVDKWGEWGEKGDVEAGQPSKRKADSPTQPNSAAPRYNPSGGFFGGNPQQAYPGISYTGHNVQQNPGPGHTNHKSQVSENRYRSNQQNVYVPRSNPNYQRAYSGFFPSKNIQQHSEYVEVMAKDLPENGQHEFSIKPQNVGSNSFFGQRETGTPVPFHEQQKYQQIKHNSQQPIHGQNFEQRRHQAKDDLQYIGKPKPFVHHSTAQFNNPFKSFKEDPIQENVKQKERNQGFNSVNSFNQPRRNFPINNKPQSKSRSNFGFQAPPANFLGPNKIKVSQSNLRPNIPFQGLKGPVFVDNSRQKNNFKRKIPGRFQPVNIPVPPSPIAENPFDSGDFANFEDANNGELEDKEFMKDFEKFSSDGFKEEINLADGKDTDYSNDFFNDPEGENFDFSDFDEFESFDYENINNDNNNEAKTKEETQKKSTQLLQTNNSPSPYQVHNGPLRRENHAEDDYSFSRAKYTPEEFKADALKETEKRRDSEVSKDKKKKLDFSYSTEGLELFKHSKNRKPTYKDPYRKPDEKYSSFKKPMYDPDTDFEPLFDFGDSLSGFGPDFTGEEFDFGSDDETAEQARTLHNQNDYQHNYEKSEEYNDYHNEAKGEGFKTERDYFPGYESEMGKMEKFDQDKEYLDKVFSEFQGKYGQEERMVQKRKISQKKLEDEYDRKSNNDPEMITQPFEQEDMEEDRVDKYDYVHEKLMTKDHWETKNMIPESAIDNLNSAEKSKEEAEFDKSAFSNKKGIESLEFVDDPRMKTNGGAWIPMTKESLDVS